MEESPFQPMFDQPEGGFDGLNPGSTPEAEEEFAEEREKYYQIVSCVKKLESNNPGEFKVFMDYLNLRFVQEPTWNPEMNLIQAIPNGFGREGQKSVVEHIVYLLKQAKDFEPPTEE